MAASRAAALSRLPITIGRVEGSMRATRAIAVEEEYLPTSSLVVPMPTVRELRDQITAGHRCLAHEIPGHPV